MSKKYTMFPSGKIVAISGGIPKKASKEEQVDYLASLLPGTYKGEKIEQVRFDPTDGFVHGRTASHHIRKKVTFAQQATHHNEPIDGTQNVKETKVPRNKAKSNPEIDPGDKSVKNPTKVRSEGYELGTGAEDNHTDVVPRSKGNSGLKGSTKTTYEDESGDKQTSGNPDTYVQTVEKSQKPASAGSEENHATAGSEIKIKSEQEIYQNLKLSGKLPPWLEKNKKDDDDDEKDDDKKKDKKKDKKDDDDKDEKKDDDKKDKKKGNLPPWLNKNKKDKEASVDEEELREVQAELLERDKEITSLKLIAGRTKEATAYALSLLKLNPAKYSAADVFTDLIEKTASSMSIESIRTASEEMKVLFAEKQRIDESIIKEASVEGPNSGDGGIITSLNTIDPNDGRFQKEASTDELSKIMMSGTKLGRAMEDYDTYVPSEPR